MQKNQIVLLKAKTRHGKNRIRQFGEVWIVKEVRGDRILVADWPAEDDLRWIDLPEDRDFGVLSDGSIV